MVMMVSYRQRHTNVWTRRRSLVTSLVSHQKDKPLGLLWLSLDSGLSPILFKLSYSKGDDDDPDVDNDIRW